LIFSWSTLIVILQRGGAQLTKSKNNLNSKLLRWADRLIAAVFAQPDKSGVLSREVSHFMELFERNDKQKNKVLLYNSWYTI
jgi:TorA maturation chaperone TorD